MLNTKKISLFKKTTLFWIISSVVLCSLVFVLRGILMPFVLSFILAYILNPLIVKLQNKHFSRTLATSLVIFLLALAVLSSILILLPVLQAQIISFVVKVPTLANSLWLKVQPVFELIKEHISETQLSYLKETLSVQTSNFFGDISSALMRLFTGWSALFNVISFLIITPVVVFYLLLDWNEIVEKIKQLIPVKNAELINTKINEMDEILSAFIRGQAIVCLFLALFYGFGLTAIDLDFGFSIGFISGLFSFIPYVGSLTGFVLSLLLAFTQSADWVLFLGILMVFGAGQFLEGYVLTPKLVGDKIGLHPVWVIFALMAGGYLFGFLGILLAVPVSAVLGVLVRSAISCYKNSVYYKG
ncbi:MAG: AI-2E family transporter [Alphaproteobacteria bacterium]|nr:AI-2E family transporter [Alphaproteobacteria bacterium]